MIIRKGSEERTERPKSRLAGVLHPSGNLEMPLPSVSEALKPIVLAPAPPGPWRCAHLELSPQAPALSSSESKILRSLGPWHPAPEDPEPCLHTRCGGGQQTASGLQSEGNTAVKASTLQEGRLPRLGVGLTRLTFQRLGGVVLGRWERKQRRIPQDTVFSLVAPCLHPAHSMYFSPVLSPNVLGRPHP